MKGRKKGRMLGMSDEARKKGDREEIKQLKNEGLGTRVDERQ